MSCGPIQDAAKNLAAEIAEAVEAEYGYHVSGIRTNASCCW